MRLSDDIVDYIHARFSPADVPRVLEILHAYAKVLSTPRVQRSVLFLADGSLTMLRHYAATAALDVREILTRAEYVIGVSRTPMPIRSMSQPFPSRQILQTPPPEPEEPPGERMPAQAAGRKPADGLHQHLVGESFTLGNADYDVMPDQQHPQCVRCRRRSGNIVSIVHLPLVFVMEQLSEHIELYADDTSSF